MARPSGKRTTLYDTEQLNAVLDAMARQAAGLITGRKDITLVGIMRRGVPLAELIEDRLIKDYGVKDITLLTLQIKRYSDDLKLIYPQTQLIENPEHTALNLSDKTVIIVDDVMYRGHSMLRAVEYIANKEPAEIRTLVLVDRGVEKLPVKADIVGVRLDVAPPDIIECNIPPYEDELKIELLQLTKQ